MKSYILFDLDGTLTDPKVGICTCVQYALKSFGIEEPDIDKLEPFIGPPLKDSFMKYYDLTEEQAEAAIDKYRERFQDTGIFENELYGGIHNMLRQLKAAGIHLAVASSKPTVYVERILVHFKLDKYFEAVVGSELDGTRMEKSEVIMEALGQLFGGADKIDMTKVYMVGDRSYDVKGAHELGAEAVGVTYGYGSMEELKEAKCDYIVQSVEELRKFLMREAREMEEAQKERADTSKNKAAGEGKLKFTVGDLWQLAYAFLLYMVVRFAVEYGLSLLMSIWAGRVAEATFWFVYENGEPTGFTGNASTIINALAHVGGAAAIFRKMLKLINRTKDDMRLEHLVPDPVWTILVMVPVTCGSVVGLNLLFELSGITEKSAAYQAVQMDQYSASFVIGLIAYGIITPIAEEIAFRGLVYNYLRAFFRTTVALLLAAALFGFYHGNAVQGVYAGLMGALMIYAYEYFGTFLAPVLIHIASNVISYSLSYTALGVSGFVSWPVCILALAIAAGGLFFLGRRKKVLN